MAVLRAGRLYGLLNGEAYYLGTLLTISVSPNLYPLTQLGGGGGQIESLAVAVEVASMPTTSEAVINKHISLVWMEAAFDGEIKYIVKQLNDVVLEPPARSAVAKGSGSTTVTTLALNGTAFLDYYDEYKEVDHIFNNYADAITYIDSLTGGEEDDGD